MAINELNRLSKASQGVLATSDTNTESYTRSQVLIQNNGASFISSFEGSWAGDYKLVLGKEASNPGTSSIGLEGFGDIDFVPYADRTNAVSYKGQAQVGSPISFEIVGPSLKSSGFKDVTWTVTSEAQTNGGSYLLTLSAGTLSSVYGLSLVSPTGYWAMVYKGDAFTRRENSSIFKITAIGSTTLRIADFDLDQLSPTDIVRVVILKESRSTLLNVPNTNSYVILPPARALNSGLWPVQSAWTGDSERYGVGALVANPKPMALVAGGVLNGNLGSTVPASLEQMTIVYDDTTTAIFGTASYYEGKLVKIAKVKNLSEDAVLSGSADLAVGYFEVVSVDATDPSAVSITVTVTPTISHKTGVINYEGIYLTAGSAQVEFTLHEPANAVLDTTYRPDQIEQARVKRLISPQVSSSGSAGEGLIPASGSTSVNECTFVAENSYKSNLLDLGFKAVVFGGSSMLGSAYIDPKHYTVDYEGAIVYFNEDMPTYDNYFISCVPVTEDVGQQGFGARVRYEGKDVFCGNIDISSVKTGDGSSDVVSAVSGVNTSLNFPAILASEVPETGVIEINTGSSRTKIKYSSKSALGDDSVVISDLTYMSSPIDIATAISAGHICFVRHLYSTREDTLQAGASVRANELNLVTSTMSATKNIDGSVEVPSGGFYAQELVGALPVGSNADIGRIHWDADTQTWQVKTSPRGGEIDAYEVNLEVTRGSITASKVLELTGADVEVHTTLLKATSVNLTPISDNTPNTTVTFGIDTNDFNSPETFIGDIAGMKVEVAGVSYKTALNKTQFVADQQLVYSFNTNKGEQWQPDWQVYSPELDYSTATISQIKNDLATALGADHVGWADEAETEILLTGEDVNIFPTNSSIQTMSLFDFVKTTVLDNLINKDVKNFIQQGATCRFFGTYPENSDVRQMMFRVWYYVNGFKYILNPVSVVGSKVELDPATGWVLLTDSGADTNQLLATYIMQLDNTFYIETKGVVSPSPTDQYTLWFMNPENPTGISLFPAETSNYDGLGLQYLHRVLDPSVFLVESNISDIESDAIFRGPIDSTATGSSLLSNRYLASQYVVTTALENFIQLDSADLSKPNRWVILYNFLSEANLMLDVKSDDQTKSDYTCISFWKQLASLMNYLLLDTSILAKSASAGFVPSTVDPSGWIYGLTSAQKQYGRMGLVGSTSYTNLQNQVSYALSVNLEMPVMWVAPDDVRHPNHLAYNSATGCVSSTEYNTLALVMTGHCSSVPGSLDLADFIKILARLGGGDVGENPNTPLSALISMGGLFSTRNLGLFTGGKASDLNKTLGLKYTQPLGALKTAHRTLLVSGNTIKAEFDYQYGDRNPSRPIRSTGTNNGAHVLFDKTLFGTYNAYYQTNLQAHPLDSGLTNTVTQPEATYGLSNWGLENMGFLSTGNNSNFHALWLKITGEKENETFGITLKGSLTSPEVLDTSIQVGDIVFFSYLNGEESLHGSGRVFDKTGTAVRILARSLDSSKDVATGFVPASIESLVTNGTDFGFTGTDLISIVSGGTTTLTAQGAIKSISTPNALANSLFASNWEGGIGTFGSNPAAVLVSGGRVGLLSGFDQPAGLNFAKPVTGTYTEDRSFETFIEQGVFTTSSYPNQSAGKSAGLLGALNKESHVLKSTEAPATGGIAGLRISGDTQIWVSNPRYLSSRGTKTAFVEGYFLAGTTNDKDKYPKSSFSFDFETNIGGAHRPDGFGSLDWGTGRYLTSSIVNLGLTMADIKGITSALSMDGFLPDLYFGSTDFPPGTGTGETLFKITQSVKLSPLSLPFLRDTYLTLGDNESSNNTGIWKVVDTPVLVPVDEAKSENIFSGSYSSIHQYGVYGEDAVRLGLNAIVATLRVRVERFISYANEFDYSDDLSLFENACSWSFSQYNPVTSTYNPIVMMDVVSLGADTEQDLFGLEINPRALGKKSLPASIIPITSTFPTPVNQWENKDAVRLLGVHRLMNEKGSTPSVAFLSIQDPTGNLFASTSSKDQARIVIYSADRADRMDELAGVSTQGKFADSNSGQLDSLGHPKRLGLGVVIDGGLGVIAVNAVRTHNVKGPQDKLGSIAVFGSPFMNPYDEVLDADPITLSSRLNRTEFYGDVVVAGYNSDIVIEDSRASYGFYSRAFESKISSSTMLNHFNKTLTYQNNSISYDSLPILGLLKHDIFPQVNYNDTLLPWTKAGIKIKGAGSVVYERGFSPKDATGANLLLSLTKGAKSDLGVKGLEIPAFGECLLLPKGPESLFSFKVPYSVSDSRQVKIGLTPTDHPLYEFYNGTNAFAFGGLFSINAGDLLHNEAVSSDTQKVPSLSKNQVRNAPEFFPGFLSQAYHHLNSSNTQVQVRLLEGMILEDVTTGTFYSVGDIGRFRAFGSDSFIKPLGASGDVSIWKNQKKTGDFTTVNIIDSDYKNLWNTYFDYPAMRPFSVGGCIGANGHGFDAEFFYDLSPHFDYDKPLTTTTNASLTTGGETGFGDRVDNGNVRRPSVGHKMRIVPNVEFVPVLGHRSVTGGMAVPYDKDTDYATYIQDADAILYDINYSFTKQDIGKTLYLCGSREYALVGWYIISDVISDYVLDPDLSLFSAGLDVAVVRKVKRTGEPLSILIQEFESVKFNQNSIKPILPLRPTAPVIHASLDYNTNGNMLGGQIVDTHTHDPFFPKYLSTTDTGMLTASGITKIRPYIDPTGLDSPTKQADKLFSDLTFSLEVSDGRVFSYRIDKDTLASQIQNANGGYLSYGYEDFNTIDLCDYLNSNNEANGVAIGKYLKSQGQAGWSAYDDTTPLLVWEAKTFSSERITANNQNSPYLPRPDATGLETYTYQPSIDPSVYTTNKICGFTCSINKRVLDLLGVDTNLLCGRSTSFSVSFTFNPQLDEASPSVSPYAPTVTDFSLAYHPEARGFYSFKGHSSEFDMGSFDANSYTELRLFSIIDSSHGTLLPTDGAGTTRVYTQADANLYKRRANAVCSSARGLRWVFSAPLLEENVGSYVHLTKQRPYRFGIATKTQWDHLNSSLQGGETGVKVNPYSWTSGWQRSSDSIYENIDVNTDIFRVNRCPGSGTILLGGDCESYGVENNFVVARNSQSQSVVRGGEIAYSPLTVMGNWQDTDTGVLPATGAVNLPIMYALQPIAREKIVTISPSSMTSNTYLFSSTNFTSEAQTLDVVGLELYPGAKPWVLFDKNMLTSFGISPTTVSYNSLITTHNYINTFDGVEYTKSFYTQDYSWSPASEWWQIVPLAMATTNPSPATLRIDLTETFTNGSRSIGKVLLSRRRSFLVFQSMA